ncbi:MAG: flagellar biosynthesis protein FlhF [Treponema sp.]|jgi:flagellar biosynthesis protein FlhF|nr:flagellar biosynthesis protein FlhF [Treponema sp.]
MEMYIEQGENRMECELKIARKYNRPFQILREKEISTGGFLGLFSKTGVQVEFCFSTSLRKPVPAQQNADVIKAIALEEEKKKLIAAASVRHPILRHPQQGKEASQEILNTLKELKDKIEGNTKKEEHPAFVRAVELLKANDFSDSYINGMIERLRKELSLEQLENHALMQDKLLLWIGESISIYKEDSDKLAENSFMRKPRIMILVGPTGVGKTTTISKLAAIFGIETEENPAVDVRMITIDAYRIGAKEQLMQIGDIMQIPVCCVVNKQDLRKEIALHSEDTDLFLIDTIGKSPKDASKLGEMKEILEGAGRNAEFHLAVSASTKTSDIMDIMQQYEPFNYKSVVLTKMDETDRIGNLISALAEKKKSVSYITDGQTVPVDIKKASVVRFLINLEGFKINREMIDKRFPSGEADQFKWK